MLDTNGVVVTLCHQVDVFHDAHTIGVACCHGYIVASGVDAHDAGVYLVLTFRLVAHIATYTEIVAAFLQLQGGGQGDHGVVGAHGGGAYAGGVHVTIGASYII